MTDIQKSAWIDRKLDLTVRYFVDEINSDPNKHEPSWPLRHWVGLALENSTRRKEVPVKLDQVPKRQLSFQSEFLKEVRLSPSSVERRRTSRALRRREWGAGPKRR